MEEMELFKVTIELNGKKELREVERVEVGRWDLPKLIPRLYPGETLVETPIGYKILRSSKYDCHTSIPNGCVGWTGSSSLENR